MGYPSSVDVGGILTRQALYDGDLATGGTSVLVANTVYLVNVPLDGPATLTNVRAKCIAGGAGHYDTGIYDASGGNGAPGNLLAHSAATATSLVTASTTLTPALIGGNLYIPQPGRYWLALWVDNATDTWYRASGGGGAPMMATLSGTNAGPLPALASSITGLADSGTRPILIGLLLGGWS